MYKAYTAPTVLLFVHVTYIVTLSYSNLKSKKDHYISVAHKIHIFKMIPKHVYFLKSGFKK
jgi:hypothetical protein